MKYLKILIVLISVGVLVLLVLMAVWPETADVDVAAVMRGPLSVTLDEEGKTRVRERFTISAPVAGRIQRIELEPGDRVVKDQTVIATLMPADPVLLDVRSRTEAEAGVKAAEAALGRARAERERAAAAARLAKSELARMQDLLKHDVVSQQRFDSAKTEATTAQEALSAAEFGVAAAEHELTMARARLLSTSRAPGESQPPIVLRAPVSGVVLKRMRESESVVPVGETLVELGDPRNLEIVADFLSTDAVRIRPGNPVHIERWGGERVVGGRVRRVEPSGFMKVSALGVEEQRVSVLIDFDDPYDAWKRLGDGYRVEVRVVVWHEQDVLKVPTGSLFRRGEKWAVFTVKDGSAQLRTIEIGRRSGTEAHVISGLDEGEIVIIHPSDSIVDGSRVRYAG